MMNVMIHELTGGHWGAVLRPPLEAAMLTLPFVAVLALPLLFGLTHLFEWARPESSPHREIIEAKRWFLNVPGFAVRNVAWLVIWSALALWFVTLSAAYRLRLLDRILGLGQLR